MTKNQKTMSFRDARTEADVCRLVYDHATWGDWTIMTNGYRVWISRQKIGEEPTHHIEVPKGVFDRLHDAYARQRKIVDRGNDGGGGHHDSEGISRRDERGDNRRRT